MTIFYESVYHLVCETGSYQTNEYSLCPVWFDYSAGCNDATCDGNTRMSLTTASQTWMATNYPALDATSTNMCTLSAPTTLPSGSILIEVQKVCQQICNACPDTTSASPTSTTTTLTNTRKSGRTVQFILVLVTILVQTNVIFNDRLKIYRMSKWAVPIKLRSWYLRYMV